MARLLGVQTEMSYEREFELQLRGSDQVKNIKYDSSSASVMFI